MSKLGVFGNLQSKIAHASTIPSLGNKDLKLLQDWIAAEKGVLLSLQGLAATLDRSCEAMKAWGFGEGDDLADVLLHTASMISHVSGGFTRLAEQEGTMRQQLKGIRAREENLDDMRKRRRALWSKAEAAEKKLSKMSQENKGLAAQTELLSNLREEIRQADGAIFAEETRIVEFKRHSAKDVVQLKFGGIFELAEKATIIGELGKLLVEEIPIETVYPGQHRRPYTGHERTKGLAEEAAKCVNSVAYQVPPPTGMAPPRSSDDHAAMPPQPLDPSHQFSTQQSLHSPTVSGTSQMNWSLPPQTQTSPLTGPPSPSNFRQHNTAVHFAPDPNPYNQYSEFGESASPASRRPPGTFPIASSHMRDGAFSTGGAETISGRPSDFRRSQPQPMQYTGMPEPQLPEPQLPEPQLPEDPESNASAIPEPPLSASTGPAPLTMPVPNPWNNQDLEPKSWSEGEAGPREESALPYMSSSPAIGDGRGRGGNESSYGKDGEAYGVRRPAMSPVILTEEATSDSPTAIPPSPGNRRVSTTSAETAARDAAAARSAGAELDAQPRMHISLPRPRLDVSPAPSGTSGRSSYGTPSEGPAGARTISAAAFRRAPRASGEDLPETAPLQLGRKAATPTSPYPAGRGPANESSTNFSTVENGSTSTFPEIPPESDMSPQPQVPGGYAQAGPPAYSDGQHEDAEVPLPRQFPQPPPQGYAQQWNNSL